MRFSILFGALLFALLSLTDCRNVPAQVSTNVAGWATPCKPLGGLTTLTMDGVVVNGTVYAVVAAPDGTITTLQFTQGRCDATQVQRMPTINMGIVPMGVVEALQPRIAASDNGDVAITYRGGTSPNYIVYYQRKPSTSSTFGLPIRVGTGNVGGIAIDKSGVVHVVWYDGSGGWYRRFDSTDHVLDSPIQLTTSVDAEPKVALDEQGNAHILWIQYPTPTTIRYRQYSNGVSTSPIRTISGIAGNALYPDLTVGDRLETVFDGTVNGVHQIFYAKCDLGGVNCSASRNLSNSTNSSANPRITTCSIPYISYYNDDSGKAVYVSANFVAKLVQPGSFSSPFAGQGMVNLLYRDTNGQLAYTYLSDATCGASGTTSTPTSTVTHTATNTPTHTPTLTHTPTRTATPTSTPTETKKPTNTPTATPTPTQTSTPTPTTLPIECTIVSQTLLPNGHTQVVLDCQVDP